MDGTWSAPIGQEEKAPLSMVVTPSEMTTEGILHPAKACSPIVVTRGGMTTESQRLPHLSKAPSSNFVSDSGKFEICSNE